MAAYTRDRLSAIFVCGVAPMEHICTPLRDIHALYMLLRLVRTAASTRDRAMLPSACGATPTECTCELSLDTRGVFIHSRLVSTAAFTLGRGIQPSVCGVAPTESACKPSTRDAHSASLHLQLGRMDAFTRGQIVQSEYGDGCQEASGNIRSSNCSEFSRAMRMPAWSIKGRVTYARCSFVIRSKRSRVYQRDGPTVIEYHLPPHR